MIPVFQKVTTAEKSRTYNFGDRSVTIPNVTAVGVSKSGSHRLETKDGRKVIVPPTWISLEIDTKKWSF